MIRFDVRYSSARWANPDNQYHKRYQRAWDRRFWFVLCMLHIVALMISPEHGVSLILPAVLAAFLIAAVVLWFVMMAVVIFSDWWNGAP